MAESVSSCIEYIFGRLCYLKEFLSWATVPEFIEEMLAECLLSDY